MRNGPLVAFALAFTLVAAVAKETPTTTGTVQLSKDYSLDEAFHPEELRALSKKSKRSSSENRRLMFLVLRAAIEKDETFKDLLSNSAIREATNVDLALSAYEFMLNQDSSALDRILAELATEDIGADTDTIIVMSVMDEWDLTIRAFRKHFVHTDSAGGLSKAAFVSTRSSLYPEQYKKMQEVIEAPVVWTAPLLP